MVKRIITITEDGGYEWAGDFEPAFVEAKDITKRRVSRIIPDHWLKRPAFLLLRWIFGDDGKVAAWTRTWKGPVTCELMDYDITSHHWNRAIAIGWEKFFLAELEQEEIEHAINHPTEAQDETVRERL